VAKPLNFLSLLTGWFATPAADNLRRTVESLFGV
jgi:hypothetical protein